jgi:polyisoprenoid-binding protein YceI
MKNKLYAAVAAIIISLSAFTFTASTWKVKGDGYVVEFTGGNIHGTIKGLKADIVFDKNAPEAAKISATIQVPTLATGFFIKTSHAKDALGADEHPTIKFVSTSVSKNGDGYLAKGDLNIKGVTKPGMIHFTFEDKGNEGVFKGTLKMIPKDFGIDRFGTPDEVTVSLTVPVTRG